MTADLGVGRGNVDIVGEWGVQRVCLHALLPDPRRRASNRIDIMKVEMAGGGVYFNHGKSAVHDGVDAIEKAQMRETSC
jgi:hypothetical protein